MAQTIQIKRGTQAQIIAGGMATGEQALATDTGHVFVYDGAGKVLVGKADTDPFASRPAPGVDGLFFYATDTGALYIDDGTAWQVIGASGPGGADTNIQYNSSGVLTGSSKFTWNDTTGGLSINTTLSSAAFSIAGTQAAIYLKDIDAGADLKFLQVINSGGYTRIRSLTDVGAVNKEMLSFQHATGNVGVGTSSAYSRLSLGANMGSVLNRIALAEITTTGHYFYGMGVTDLGGGDYATSIWATTGAALPTNNNAIMHVHANGYVSIGRISAAGVLTVKGDGVVPIINARDQSDNIIFDIDAAGSYAGFYKRHFVIGDRGDGHAGLLFHPGWTAPGVGVPDSSWHIYANEAAGWFGFYHYFNAAGASVDAYSMFIMDDGSIHVGGASTTANGIARLSIDGVFAMKETTAPSLTAGYGKLYAKSSDGKLYYMDDSGAEHALY